MQLERREVKLAELSGSEVEEMLYCNQPLGLSRIVYNTYIYILFYLYIYFIFTLAWDFLKVCIIKGIFMWQYKHSVEER